MNEYDVAKDIFDLTQRIEELERLKGGLITCCVFGVLFLIAVISFALVTYYYAAKVEKCYKSISKE